MVCSLVLLAAHRIHLSKLHSVVARFRFYHFFFLSLFFDIDLYSFCFDFAFGLNIDLFTLFESCLTTKTALKLDISFSPFQFEMLVFVRFCLFVFFFALFLDSNFARF